MTGFDFKEIERIAKEKQDKHDEEVEKIREENRRHIAEITKELPKITKTDFEITKEQKREIKRLEAKYGKVVVTTAGENTKTQSEYMQLSVLEAKRKHSGTWKIIGKIVTVSEMYVIEVDPVPPATDITTRDAKTIQLEDIDKLNDNE